MYSQTPNTVDRTYESGQVRDARQRCVDSELERDGSEQQNEGQLDAMFRLQAANRVRCEHQTADVALSASQTHP